MKKSIWYFNDSGVFYIRGLWKRTVGYLTIKLLNKGDKNYG